MLRSTLRLVTPLVLLFALIPSVALAGGGSFVDDDGSTHEPSIEAIADEGVTKGCNPPFNDEFCPDDPVTRGQMAAFLRRALEGIVPEGAEQPFDDIAGSTFEADIKWLSRTGITSGCNPPANTSFCPEEFVTRGQMAAFLRRALEGLLAEGTGIAFLDTAGTTFEADIAWLSRTGVTKGCNPPTNNLYCPGDLVTRAQMATFLLRALELDPIPVAPRGDLALVDLGVTMSLPTYLTAPDGDDRLFVTQKAGRIRIVESGSVLPTPFLDLVGLVESNGEKGLLSMAFHPDYESNGRFFVYYSGDTRPGAPPGTEHTAYIVEYEVSGDPDVADAGSASVVMEIDQPASNHDGGHILFGPDGYLYIALGDGGGSGDPYENGQDLDTLLGSILRIDVDGAGPYEVPADNPYVGAPGEDEIWISGVRNPWRVWFDGGSLYVADVGQQAREEITVVPDDAGGLDLGWNTLEGSRCFDPSSGCSSAGTVLPSLEYAHLSGCNSLTGGVVYRGSVSELDQWYLYTDVCRSWVKAARFVDGDLFATRDLTADVGPAGGVWSFGVDGHGEVYMLFGSSGKIMRFAEI